MPNKISHSTINFDQIDFGFLPEKYPMGDDFSFFKKGEKMPLLGISAKSSSTLPLQPASALDSSKKKYEKAALNFDPNFEPEKPKYCPATIRLERFALQSVSRSILRYSGASRVARCLRVPFDKNTGVGVHRSHEYKACSYSNLQTCSSVWTCPVCASKISERRRIEVLHAIEQHKSLDGYVYLLTLTVPHKKTDDLKQMLDSQALALKYFGSGRQISNFYKSIGYLGQIRALEVTHGRLRQYDNGWHPHYHILLFVSQALPLDASKAKFYLFWHNACIKAGFSPPSFEHGISLDNGEKAAAYVSKMGETDSDLIRRWGLDSEMTKAHIKKSNKGETPFDLLRAVFATSDKKAAALFKEFSFAFKGKRQLLWSPGLKARFGVAEKSDEILTSELEDDAVFLGSIGLDDWRLILDADLRGEVLELGRDSWESIQQLISMLRGSHV